MQAVKIRYHACLFSVYFAETNFCVNLHQRIMDHNRTAGAGAFRAHLTKFIQIDDDAFEDILTFFQNKLVVDIMLILTPPLDILTPLWSSYLSPTDDLTILLLFS